MNPRKSYIKLVTRNAKNSLLENTSTGKPPKWKPLVYVKGHDFRDFTNMVSKADTSVVEANLDSIATLYEHYVEGASPAAVKGLTAAMVEMIKRVSPDAVDALGEAFNPNTSVLSIPDDLKKEIYEACEDVSDMDRVLSNIRIINNRFNTTKYIKEHYNYPVKDVVTGLCEFIDTYGSPIWRKFLYCVETVQYMLQSSGYPVSNPDDIYHSICEYFLSTNHIISDSNYSAIKRISKVHEIEDITEQYLGKGDMYTTIMEGLMGKELVDTTLRARGKYINDEKRSQKFVEAVVTDLINTQGVLDVPSFDSIFEKEKNALASTIPAMNTIHRKVNAISSIPLVLDVKRTCVYSQALNAMRTNHDISYNLERFMTAQLENQLCGKYTDMAFCKEPSYLDEFVYSARSMRMMMEDGTAVYSIKDFIKKYYGEQQKNVSTFRRFMSAIYAKPVKYIVEDTHSILAMVRKVFILSPVVVPVVGPILSAVALMFDKLMERKMTADQCKELISAMREEKRTVKGKLDSLDGIEKEKAEKYIEELDKYIAAQKEYLERLDEDPGEDDTDDFGGDFDFDFGNFDDDDIKWEFAYVLDGVMKAKEVKEGTTVDDDTYFMESLTDIALYTESLITICENDMRSLIRRNIDKIIKEGSFDTLCEMMRFCPLSIDYKEFMEMVEPWAKRNSTYGMQPIVQTASYFSECTIPELGTCRLHSVIKEGLTIQALHEGLKTSDLKLAWSALKAKMKTLSAKEKAACSQLDAAGNELIRALQNAAQAGRREAIIKGQICPSLSKLLKISIGIGAVALFNPIAGLITAVGLFGSSKILNAREKVILLDEIDTELKVVELEIDKAKNDDDANRYRFLLNYQKKLTRERKRIKYGLRGKERILPTSSGMAN